MIVTLNVTLHSRFSGSLHAYGTQVGWKTSSVFFLFKIGRHVSIYLDSLGHTSRFTAVKRLEHPAVKIYTTGWRCTRILIRNFYDQRYPVNKTAATSKPLAYVY